MASFPYSLPRARQKIACNPFHIIQVDHLWRHRLQWPKILECKSLGHSSWHYHISMYLVKRAFLLLGRSTSTNDNDKTLKAWMLGGRYSRSLSIMVSWWILDGAGEDMFRLFSKIFVKPWANEFQVNNGEQRGARFTISRPPSPFQLLKRNMIKAEPRGVIGNWIPHGATITNEVHGTVTSSYMSAKGWHSKLGIGQPVFKKKTWLEVKSPSTVAEFLPHHHIIPQKESRQETCRQSSRVCNLVLLLRSHSAHMPGRGLLPCSFREKPTLEHLVRRAVTAVHGLW